MNLIPLSKSPQIHECHLLCPPHQTLSFPPKYPQFPPTRQEFVVFEVPRSIWAPADPKTHLSTSNMLVNPEGPKLVGYKVNLMVSLMLSSL